MPGGKQEEEQEEEEEEEKKKTSARHVRVIHCFVSFTGERPYSMSDQGMKSGRERRAKKERQDRVESGQ